MYRNRISSQIENIFGYRSVPQRNSYNPYPGPLRELILALKNLKEPDMVGKILRNAETKVRDLHSGSIYKGSVGGNVYYYKGGYELMTGLPSITEQYFNNLLTLNKIKIRSAPILNERFEVKNEKGNAKVVFVNFFPELKVEQLVPYSEMMSRIPYDAKKRFLYDMERLTSNGLIHNYASLGIRHWYVNPNTHDIYLNSWDALNQLEYGEKDQHLSDLKGLLQI